MGDDVGDDDAGNDDTRDVETGDDDTGDDEAESRSGNQSSGFGKNCHLPHPKTESIVRIALATVVGTYSFELSVEL